MQNDFIKMGRTTVSWQENVDRRSTSNSVKRIYLVYTALGLFLERINPISKLTVQSERYNVQDSSPKLTVDIEHF